MVTDRSIANIKTVQEVYAAFGRRDIKAILALLSPEVEWGEPAVRSIRLVV
jgi:ketosteroid isomerase-like protein